MMKPSKKSPQVERLLKDLTGVDRRAVIWANRCMPKPFGCGGMAATFRDTLSAREYAISALCQNCQDELFDAPE